MWKQQSAIDERNTKRSKTQADMAALMATGLSQQVALNYDPEWEQAYAKLRVRVAQELTVLQQDLLAWKQHASWEKDRENYDARAEAWKENPAQVTLMCQPKPGCGEGHGTRLKYTKTHLFGSDRSSVADEAAMTQELGRIHNRAVEFFSGGCGEGHGTRLKYSIWLWSRVLSPSCCAH
jgi:hypothetical protein